MRQTEKQLTVHLGETPQLETPEKIVGVICRADDVPGPDRVIVAVDPLVPASPPSCMAEQERGAVVNVLPDRISVRLSMDTYRREVRNVGVATRTQLGC